MDQDSDVLILNRNKNKRKLIVSSDEDEQSKKIKNENQEELRQKQIDVKEEIQDLNSKDIKTKTPRKESGSSKQNINVINQKQNQKISKEKQLNNNNLKQVFDQKQNQQQQQQNKQNNQQQLQQQQQISKPKYNIVYEILKRWWYCMEDWPPVNYDYDQKLKEKGFRKVEINNWKQELDTNQEGLQKVYGIQGYLGLFKSMSGQLIDVRPQELCPSFDNLKNKSLRELFELLIKAYQNQIEEYKSLHSDEQDASYLLYLQNSLKKTQSQQKSLLEKIQSMKDSQIIK